MTTNDKLADAPITHDEAAEAVSSMDDFAKMDVSVDPFGPRATLERYIAQQRAASLAAPPARGEWAQGAPSKPWSEEWFIAVTTSGDRVVLRALPESYTYDFTTADDTYIKRDRIAKWMQFPDSEFIAPQPAPAPVQAVCNRNCDCVGECKADVERPTAQPPAPEPVRVDDALGRFGHHPDPATDFEVEVTSLQGRLFNAKHAIPDKHGVTESVAQVADAIKRAMTFRVGGVETSVRAKSILRALELDAAQPPAPGEAELPPLPNPQVPFIGCDPSLTDVRVLVNWYKRGATAYARAAIAALAQRRVPDAVRELPGIWCERTPRHADARAAYTQCAAELRSALASAEGNAVDLVQFRYDVEGWRDCARALAKVCDRPADCAYAEAESVRLLALIDQQQEARGNGE